MPSGKKRKGFTDKMSKKIGIFIVLIGGIFIFLYTSEAHAGCIYYYLRSSSSCNYDRLGPSSSSGAECTIGKNPYDPGDLIVSAFSSCYESTCIRGLAGTNNKCPDTGSCNGSYCIVKKDCWGGISCYGQNCEGKWDASTRSCVNCVGTTKVSRFGSSTGIDVQCGSCWGTTLTQTCESGCGAPSDLDDFSGSAARIKNLTCPSGTLSVNRDFNISYAIAKQSSQYVIQTIERNGVQDTCYYSSSESPSMCIWETRTRTLSTPSTAGTYTYTVKVKGSSVAWSGICGQSDASLSCTITVTGCTPGTTRPCGNCGTQTCRSDGTWDPSCNNQGVCSPGSTQSCGTCQRQTCQSNCYWGFCTYYGNCISPGATQSCGNCGTQTCQSTCYWGECSDKKAEGDLCSWDGECCANSCIFPTSGSCTNCKTTGQSCTLGSECCSGNCSAYTTGSCTDPYCLGGGEWCTGNPEDCCSGECDAYWCTAPTCKMGGESCASAGECCSGTCSGYSPGSCTGTYTCKIGGQLCDLNSECCSGSCSMAGNYACADAYCLGGGEECYDDYDCCSGYCEGLEWWYWGYCSVPTCKIGGESCASNSQCCSGTCVEYGICGTIPSVTYTLTVSKTGTGSGTVTGSGINCGTDCSESYPADTSVTLTATPDSGFTFAGWSGDCSGTGSCTLTMNSNKSATATFNAPACPSAPPSYPTTYWDRVWCNMAFAEKLADAPDQSTLQFDDNWGSGSVAGISTDNIGFRSGRTIYLDAGNYTFYLGSDDGTRLWIDGELCIDNWGDHAYQERNCTRTYSSSANHQFQIDFYENGGLARIRFYYTFTPPNQPPTASFSCNTAQCPGGTGNGNCIMYQPFAEPSSCTFTLQNNSSDPDGSIALSRWYIKKQTESDSAYRLIGSCSGVCNHTIQKTDVPEPAIYVVRLYVEDNQGASNSITRNLTVRKEVNANFMCSLDNINWQFCENISLSTGEVIYVKDDSSLSRYSTPSEGATIVSRTWEKGDGESFEVFASNTNNASTTLTQNIDTLRLTVSDNNNRTDRQGYSVKVTLPLPQWREIRPILWLTKALAGIFDFFR